MKHPHSPSDRSYWSLVEEVAKALGTDGCTGVPDFYVEVCWEHDIHYRTHRTVAAKPITRQRADCLLRLGIQDRSLFGKLSPMSWWRWAALRVAGGHAWGERSPLGERSNG